MHTAKITIIITNAAIIILELLLFFPTSGFNSNELPHLLQNFAVSLFSKPHFSHFIIFMTALILC